MVCLRKFKGSGWRPGNWSFVTVTNIALHSCGCGKILPGKLFLIACRVWRHVYKPSEKSFSIFSYTGQHNEMESFAVKWHLVSEISKVLLNEISAELDGIREWNWEYYDWQIRSWWIANRTIYQQKLHQSGKSSFK